MPEDEFYACRFEDMNYKDRIKDYRYDRKIPFYIVEEALNLPDVEAAIIETDENNLTKYATLAAEKVLYVYMD